MFNVNKNKVKTIFFFYRIILNGVLIVCCQFIMKMIFATTENSMIYFKSYKSDSLSTDCKSSSVCFEIDPDLFIFFVEKNYA